MPDSFLRDSDRADIRDFFERGHHADDDPGVTEARLACLEDLEQGRFTVRVLAFYIACSEAIIERHWEAETAKKKGKLMRHWWHMKQRLAAEIERLKGEE